MTGGQAEESARAGSHESADETQTSKTQASRAASAPQFDRDPARGANLRQFNLDTMSGVHTGTRTQVFQQIQLQPTSAAGTPEQPDQTAQWARLSWYEDPPSVLLHLRNAEDSWHEKPLLQIEKPEAENLIAALEQTLGHHSWRLAACGNCVHWLPLTVTTADGIPLGQCGWSGPDETNATSAVQESESVHGPPLLRQQSALALSCPAWTPRDGAAPAAVTPATPEPPPDPRPPGPWQRIKRRFGLARPTTAHVRWSDTIIERSGVGAGTEACLCCQGRIANLGAQTSTTADGDKHTMSVWRCRLCHTFYLNDFVDRWERTSSLEIEESYYRLAPAEALALLSIFARVSETDAPDEREMMGWLETVTNRRETLSHQVRRGR